MSFPPAAVRYERGVFLPAHDLWLDPWDNQPFAFVSHAHADHIGMHQEVILSSVTSRLMSARLPDRRRRGAPAGVRPDRHGHPPRPARDALPGRTHRRVGAVLHRERRRHGQRPLHGRLQAARGPVCRADGLDPGRHAHHGDDLRPAALRLPADRRSARADRQVLPGGHRGGRGAGALRLFAGQEPGNPRGAGPRRAARDAPRGGLQDDGGVPGTTAGLPALRALRRRCAGGQGAHLPAERQPVADAPEDQGPPHRHAHGLGADPGGRPPLPDRRLLSAERPRRLPGPAAVRGTGPAPARADAARVRGGVRAGPAALGASKRGR